MIALLVAAGLGLLTLPVLLRRVGRRLQPRQWSVLCTVALAGGASLVIGAGMLSLLSTVLRVLGLPKVARECDAMLGHLIPNGSPLAFAVLAATTSTLLFGVRSLRSSHRAAELSWVEPGVGQRVDQFGSFEVVVLEEPRTRAVSVPGTRGRPSQILLTSGLVEALAAPELDLVCAHEEAHLRLAHHRYLALATGVEAAMWFWPPAKASARALRLGLERWADETATGNALLARSRLQSALLAVAVGEPASTLAAFSTLEGLLERVAAMGDPDAKAVSFIWWPVVLIPGLLLGGVAVFALAQLGHGAYCLLSMPGSCGIR